SFTHRFGSAGSHLISLELQADPPPAERPPGYVIKDHVPGDNRQDFAVEVLQALPVLLVDGDSAAAPRRRSTDFMRDALSPARDRNPAVKIRVISAIELDAAQLGLATQAEKASTDKELPAKPRVLILCDVPRLAAAQQEAVSQFIAEGGGALITLGARAEADAYNSQLFRDGKGWLPARLDGTDGDPEKPRDSFHPAVESSIHPALELFRAAQATGLEAARFPRCWKLSAPGKGATGIPVAVLRSAFAEYPFLMEKTWKAGRVILSCVPLDNTWATNLPDLPAFVPLIHELVYYLAGARASEFNLQAGQPIRYHMNSDAELSGFTLTPPSGEAKPLSTAPADPASYPAQCIHQQNGSLLVYEDTRETGVYKLRTPESETVYYVIPPDPRESDLTPCGEDDRAKVAKLFNPLDLDEEHAPLRYTSEHSNILVAAATSGAAQEVWWWFLLGVVALLCGEVWMTKRMAANR
ncbi:MAG: hypothetical protein ACRD36_05130, partial [Candidatus Acidiferrum sp.]